jgi:trk system potassium uptake protein TrkA
MNVIIVGGGKVGTHLAALLGAGGHHVRLIEARGEEMARLRHDLPRGVALLGNGAEPAVLEAAGVRQAQVVAAVTGADETNLVVTSLARFEFETPRTIARVNNPKNAWLFTAEMGVDVALNQADLMAHLIQEEMSLGDMMTLLKLRTGQYALVEERMTPTARAVGKAVGDLALPPECAVVAVIRQGQLIIPGQDTVIEPADEILALAHSAQLARLARALDHSGA